MKCHHTQRKGVDDVGNGGNDDGFGFDGGDGDGDGEWCTTMASMD